MYFIVNTSRPPQEVYIEDLDFKIGPNKAVDLEKYRERSDIDASEDVKEMIRSRRLQLRQSFHARPKPGKKEEKPQKQGIDDSDIAKITKAVAEQLKNNTPQPQQPSGIPPELVDVLKNLTDAMNKPQQPTTVMQQGSGSPQIDSGDDDIDIDRLSELHAKAITNRTRETEGKIDYEEKEVKGKASSNADELGDLLG